MARSRPGADPRASAAADALLRTGAERAPAPAGAQCGARGQPVVIRVVDGPRALAAQRSADAAPVLSEDAETLVFADGRIVTSNLEGVGDHLGRVGWTDRELVIASRFGSGGGARVRRG